VSYYLGKARARVRARKNQANGIFSLLNKECSCGSVPEVNMIL